MSGPGQLLHADPADGRAKLIDLTPRGQSLMTFAGDNVADIEARWSALVGRDAFAQMCATMQRLLDRLRPDEQSWPQCAGPWRRPKMSPHPRCRGCAFADGVLVSGIAVVGC